MIRAVRIAQYASQSQQRAQSAWTAINTQPSWIVKATLLAFILVIGVPILLLVFLALIAAAALFAILWAFNRVVSIFKGLLPQRDGRSNVRVIQRGGPER